MAIGVIFKIVKATFFVLGEKVEAYSEIIEQMQKEGHIIGNHTYTHIQLRSGNREMFREELNMFPMLWNVDPNDWCIGNADKVTRAIVDKAKENSTILLHDCYQSSVDAALASIDMLTEMGYEFVTVEEILFE